jgi:hypothetical protein
MISREYEQWLHNVLESMSPQMRAVFKLCREENKSYDEVADLLQITKNTVKKHMVRSMRAIKVGWIWTWGFLYASFVITLHSHHRDDIFSSILIIPQQPENYLRSHWRGLLLKQDKNS